MTSLGPINLHGIEGEPMEIRVLNAAVRALLWNAQQRTGDAQERRMLEMYRYWLNGEEPPKP